MATAEYMRQWRAKNPEKARAARARQSATAAYKAYQREYHRQRRMNGTEGYQRQSRRRAALEAAAARVVAMWHAGMWSHADVTEYEAAIAQLAALLPETQP